MKHTIIAVALAGLVLGGVATGSSHREAPLITKTPKADNTDFYMFRSYEAGRSGYVTFLANFQPFQDAYGGPNYFLMDDKAQYNIHVDNDGDAIEDLTFAFHFYNDQRGLTVPVNGQDVAVPLSNIGPFGSNPMQDGNRNVVESYIIATIRNRNQIDIADNLDEGGPLFRKPFDNIGNKSIPEYAAYAGEHVFDVGFDGCATPARVFVGQREEGFKVNLGEVFDLVNTNPVGPRDGEENVLADKNISTIALEVPIACLTSGTNTIIGAWTTVNAPSRGGLRQVSRLSAPLVNEVVIGLPDKDAFNASHPSADAQFAQYVTNPTLPELIQILFPGVEAPNLFPRADLVAAFLTGIDGLNQPAGVQPAEMMRLNTAIAPKPAAMQSNLGVLEGDTAGFPNGRRPGDDVVDIELRVAMGVLLSSQDAPSGQLPYTDGAIVSATDFSESFPYLNTPTPGSPNPPIPVANSKRTRALR